MKLNFKKTKIIASRELKSKIKLIPNATRNAERMSLPNSPELEPAQIPPTIGLRFYPDRGPCRENSLTMRAVNPNDANSETVANASRGESCDNFGQIDMEELV